MAFLAWSVRDLFMLLSFARPLIFPAHLNIGFIYRVSVGKATFRKGLLVQLIHAMQSKRFR